VGDIPKMRGWTWLSPHSRPLILRIPPPYGFTLHKIYGTVQTVGLPW